MMRDYFPIIGIIALAVIVIGAILFNIDFAKQCNAHGGSHVTYPYKSWPECWADDGRRVFW